MAGVPKINRLPLDPRTLDSHHKQAEQRREINLQEVAAVLPIRKPNSHDFSRETKR